MQEAFEKNIKEALRQTDDQLEIIPGHAERFEMKLLRQKASRAERKLPRWPWMALAAAVVTGFIVAIVVMEVKKTNDFASRARLSDVSNEMAATEQFYHERLQMDLSKLNDSDANIQRFITDLKKLEEEYVSLEETLSRNFNNDRIAKAMVNNYRYRLQLMEQLQKYIEIQNKFNTQSHEEKLSS